jgi:hypothetical protein
MILRFFARLREAWGYLGLDCGHARIGPLLAWELACIRHPSPEQEAIELAKTNAIIDEARAMRARFRAEEAD